MQKIKPHRKLPAAALALLLGLTAAHAGYLIEIDTDGANNAAVTYNSHFSFGGDTTTASASAPSSAFGMTGGNSIFGGNGVNLPDTYLFRYDPSIDADNLAIPGGTDLGDGVLASGFSGGSPGVYAVYATWPSSSNVSGGPTKFTATTTGDSFVMNFDQTGGGTGTGNIWYKLGEITWSSGAITLSQEAGANTFVSMRSAGVLFEVVPEPSSLSLLILGAMGFFAMRKRLA